MNYQSPKIKWCMNRSLNIFHSSICQISPSRIVLDLESETIRGPGSIPIAIVTGQLRLLSGTIKLFFKNKNAFQYEMRTARSITGQLRLSKNKSKNKKSFWSGVSLSRGIGGSLSEGGSLSRGISVRETPSPCEQNDWQTGVKTLPSHNFVCGLVIKCFCLRECKLCCTVWFKCQ